jgi:uncharacterized membrane protein
MDENYDIRLKNLTREVNKVSDEKSLSYVFKQKINNIYIYTLAIPVIIIIILIVSKPSFIMYKNKINEPEVISYKKLSIVFFVLVVITIIVNYAYFYKKKLTT